MQDTARVCVFEQSHPNIHLNSVRNRTFPHSDLSSSLYVDTLVMNNNECFSSLF